MATMVRVDEQLHQALKQASEQEGRPIGQILADAFSQYQRAEFWKGAKADYTRLRNNPAGWQSYLEDIEVFSRLNADGLENEPSYYTAEELEDVIGRSN